MQYAVRTLLQRGLAVSATMRPNLGAEMLAATVGLTSTEATDLPVVHAELAEDHGWRKAVDGRH